MKGKGKTVDLVIFFGVIILLGIGTIMVFSSSSVKTELQFGDSLYFLKRQLVWAALGLVAMLAVSKVDYWRWRPLARPILYLSLGLLAVVLIAQVGQVAGGSRRWLGVGPLTFQPSEAAKLALIIYFSHALAEGRERLTRFVQGVLPHLAVLGLAFGLILLQPDLGTAVAIGGTFMVLLFVSGVPIIHLVMMALAAVPAVAWMVFGEEYRRRRFLAFLNPREDPLGAGYHIIQSLYALGSGGLFGLGLGRSRQKLFYLPGQHTDFIFAVLGEELGFIGGFTLLVLFFLFAWRGYRIAITAPDVFSSLLATGITTMVVLQVIVNVGVVTSTLPITGIPLPFISYGGSSLIFTLVGVGILLNISKYTA